MKRFKICITGLSDREKDHQKARQRKNNLKRILQFLKIKTKLRIKHCIIGTDIRK